MLRPFPFYKAGETVRPFDVSTKGNWAAWDVSGLLKAAVRAVDLGSTVLSGSGVLTFERSQDGFSWAALGTPVTLSAAGTTSDISLDTAKFVRSVVTDAGSGVSLALTLFGKGDTTLG